MCFRQILAEFSVDDKLALDVDETVGNMTHIRRLAQLVVKTTMNVRQFLKSTNTRPNNNQNYKYYHYIHKNYNVIIVIITIIVINVTKLSLLLLLFNSVDVDACAISTACCDLDL